MSEHVKAPSGKEAIASQMEALFAKAAAARPLLACASAEQKTTALHAMGDALLQSDNMACILAANAEDVALSKRTGASDAVLDRLSLNPDRLRIMAQALHTIADAPEPVNQMVDAWTNPDNGLDFQKITTPIGIIGMIFEARPNVNTDAAGLCLKSGNPVILRPGSNCYLSSEALVSTLKTALALVALPEGAIGLVPSTDRHAVGIMLSAKGKLDLIIPRGGKSLTERVANEARVPTLLHLAGNCHTYVDAAADVAMAVKVLVNAKLRRTGICGATESLVVHSSRLQDFLPQVASVLAANSCQLVGDARACAAVPGIILPAEPQDFAKEFLAPKLSVAVVDTLAEAIAWINTNSSGHTEAILSEDKAAQSQFMREVDSAIVVINTSTQFADGGEFGFGAEIGIATGRLPPRGPIGAQHLVTIKYVVQGHGQVRSGGSYTLSN